MILKMIEKKFKHNVSQIKNAINNDRLVVFAGAGVSKDSGIPLWSELIEDIKGPFKNRSNII
jgi:accessory colonization factor AcfC